MTRFRLALACGLATLWLPCDASADVSGLSTPELDGPAAEDVPDAQVEEAEAATGYCYSRADSQGRRSPIPLPPSFFGSVGTDGRTWEVRSTLAVRDELTDALGQWSLAASINPDHDPSMPDRLRSGPLSLVFRLNGLGVISDAPVAVRGFHPSFGVILRSNCDGYVMEAGVRLLLPWQLGQSSPDDFGSALRAVLIGGAGDDALWLPVNHTAVQLYGSISIRTADVPWFGGLAFGIMARLVLSVGSVSVATWLGSQQGFVGSSSLEVFSLVTPASLRVGLRGDVSLTSLWPAGEVLPVTFDGFLRWGPEHWLSVELFLGGAALAQSAEGGGLRTRWGATLTSYLP